MNRTHSLFGLLCCIFFGSLFPDTSLFAESGFKPCPQCEQAIREASGFKIRQDPSGILRMNAGLTSPVPLPFDFPQFEVHQYEEPAPGRIFTTLGDYLLILNNDGTPYFYRKLTYPLFDLMVQPDGLLSYSEGFCTDAKYILLDNHYNPVDTLTCGHGYDTGGHDFIRFSNGHVIYIGITYVPIDMSQLVPGGLTNAYLEENSLVEVDENDRIIFEWHCIDHFNVRDTHPIVDLTQRFIQYVHINSVSVDFDGHLVISNRSFSDVTKINHQTGEIIWRLAGPYNQFIFINESRMISFQHTARPVPGKPNHYTIFDNAFLSDTPYSRAIEYKIDPILMTAEKVWEYNPHRTVNSYSQGNAQRLSNGNTLINWGIYTKPLPFILFSEVSEAGDLLYEITGRSTDRSFRFEWEGELESPYLIAESNYDHLLLFFNQFGKQGITHYRIFADTLPVPVQLIRVSDSPYIRLLSSDLPYNDKTWYFRVKSVNSAGEESDYSNMEEIRVNFLDPMQNMIYNGDFSKEADGWELFVEDEASASAETEEDRFHIRIQNGGLYPGSVTLYQKNLKLESVRQYSLEFDAFASAGKYIEVRIGEYQIFSDRLLTELKHFSFEFSFTDPDDYQCVLQILCGGSNVDVYFDNVVLRKIGPNSIEYSGTEQPSAFELEPNYPNPFNSLTTIPYSIPKSCDVSLKIFNLAGQETAALVHEVQPAGKYQVQWQADAYPSGLYLCVMEADEAVEIKKLIVIR